MMPLRTRRLALVAFHAAWDWCDRHFWLIVWLAAPCVIAVAGALALVIESGRGW